MVYRILKLVCIVLLIFIIVSLTSMILTHGRVTGCILNRFPDLRNDDLSIAEVFTIVGKGWVKDQVRFEHDNIEN